MDTGKYVDKNGVVRWKNDRVYTNEEKAKQRKEFEEEAKKGNMICLTDLMCTHGM